MIRYQCNYPACNKTVEVKGELCSKHSAFASIYNKKENQTETVSRWSKSANDPLYNTRKWKNLRASHLETNPECAVCGTTELLQVHHIKKPNGNEDLFYDADNLMTVCRRCHFEITKEEIRYKKYGQEQP